MDNDTIRKLLAEATPGPWTVRPVEYEHDEVDIAPKRIKGKSKPPFGVWARLARVELYYGVNGSGRANARLIAAAPDLAAEVLRLREALTEALPWVEAQLDDPANKPGAVKAVAARIRAALKEADNG